MSEGPYCRKDGHDRGWHVERQFEPDDPSVDDRPVRILQCLHPAHGPAAIYCGPEAECFPEIAEMRARWRASARPPSSDKASTKNFSG